MNPVYKDGCALFSGCKGRRAESVSRGCRSRRDYTRWRLRGRRGRGRSNLVQDAEDFGLATANAIVTSSAGAAISVTSRSVGKPHLLLLLDAPHSDHIGIRLTNIEVIILASFLKELFIHSIITC